MATPRTRTSSRGARGGRISTRSTPYPVYDLGNPANWTADQFRVKLAAIGITAAKTLSKTVLKQLYTDNVNAASTSSNTTTVGPGLISNITSTAPRTVAAATCTVQSATVNDTVVMETADSELTAFSPTPTPAVMPAVNSPGADYFQQPPRVLDPRMNTSQYNDNSLTPPTSMNLGHNNNGGGDGSVLQTVNLLAQLLTQQLGHSGSASAPIGGFTLAQVYSSQQGGPHAVPGGSSRMITPVPGQVPVFNPTPSTSTAALGIAPPTSVAGQSYGIAPGDIPDIDVMSPSSRKQILEGKDVNLATLLLPYYDVPQPTIYNPDPKPKDDARLKRSLSIGEFITAFGKYKRTMCRVYKDRRDELDQFEAYAVSLHNTYGPRYYEYVRLFSMRSAYILQTHGWKIDWSKIDWNLLQKISSANATYCHSCGESSHQENMCHLSEQNQRSPKVKVPDRKLDSDSDSLGRPRQFHNGKEICNHFNNNKCIRPRCGFEHCCKKCFGPHAFSNCTAHQTKALVSDSVPARPRK
jgi:hypothetical protein